MSSSESVARTQVPNHWFFAIGDVHVIALFDPANSMLAPLARAIIIVLFEPTISSHVQAPVKVSVLLLPKMWAPPPAQSRESSSGWNLQIAHLLLPTIGRRRAFLSEQKRRQESSHL